MRSTSRFIRCLISSVVGFGVIAPVLAGDNDLLTMSVEELLNIQVTSVAKKAQALNDSPAAVFVITQDDIHRIGATSIPEALRLAPGLDVARIDGHKWAISSRGFNGRFSNKLLVLIDGRSIYTRAFAGVYWENQDVVMEDIDRIEVIRGPGATLWGANAVNGVINIITKHSADTLGGLLVAGGGTEEQGFGAFRYGGHLNQETTGRVYVKGFKRDENTFSSGGESGDDWDKAQGGFRIDSQVSLKDALTVQGDVYYAHFNQNSTLPTLVAPDYLSNFNERINSYGGNLLARQRHAFSSTSDYSLQVYYDFYHRDEVYFTESRQMVDIDFQHHFAWLDRHDVVWGAGYRYSHDDTVGAALRLTPDSRNDQLYSAFVQDEITLLDDRLWLTIGSKFEHNDYSGFEGQPTARLMWAPHHQHRVWAGASRAVRTPSRFDQDLSLLLGVFDLQNIPPNSGLNVPQTPGPLPPIKATIDGDKAFRSEDVISYELGYRTSMIDDVSIDITAFYNIYHHLRTLELGAAGFDGAFLTQSAVFTSGNDFDTYGAEIAVVWQMLDWWRWDANYSLLLYDFNDNSGQSSRSPTHRASMHGALSLTEDVDMDLLFRYVDRNHVSGTLFGSDVIQDYISLDVRLAWRPVAGLELSLVGQNLLDEQHLEYRQENLTRPTEIDRGMYGKLNWQF